MKSSKLKVYMNDNVWYLFTYFMITEGNDSPSVCSTVKPLELQFST